MKKFGKEFKREREKRGLTQDTVAKCLGYSTAQFVSNIERGQALLPKEGLKKVSKKLGFNYNRLAELAAKETSDRVYRYWLGQIIIKN